MLAVQDKPRQLGALISRSFGLSHRSANCLQQCDQPSHLSTVTRGAFLAESDLTPASAEAKGGHVRSVTPSEMAV
jgi:hypothetical protein